MPNTKASQPAGNQTGLPTGLLFEAATKALVNGGNGQMQKALEVGSYFLSGCMAVNISQLLGTPLYLINEDWYNAWIAFSKQSFGLLTTSLTQYWAPTVVRISGDKSVRGQLISTGNGQFKCYFPQRLVLMANHQIYTDWLYLWWIAYCNGMHGSVFIVLKESLRRIPILGWGMRFSQFIFLKRNWEEDKPQMAHHFQKLNKVDLPMWLLIFPEGTNLADSTRERSKAWAKKSGIQDLQHTLLPRSTGLRFSLQQMRETVKYVYDCTIAYEGVPRGQYAQDIFTVKSAYFEGKPPKSVNMYWRRFALSNIPIDDPVAFEVWLRARWMEKDSLIEAYYRRGRFPADTGAHKTRDGNLIRGSGYIESEIKSNYWYEFLQIFAPIGVLALVLYAFYNALPMTCTQALNKQNAAKTAEELQRTQAKLQKQQSLVRPGSISIPTEQDSMLVKAMKIYTGLSKNPALGKVAPLPELTLEGIKKELLKNQPAIDTILTQKNVLQDLKTKLPPIGGPTSSQISGPTNGQSGLKGSYSVNKITPAIQPAPTGSASNLQSTKNGATAGANTKQLQTKDAGSKKVAIQKNGAVKARDGAPLINAPKKAGPNGKPAQSSASSTGPKSAVLSKTTPQKTGPKLAPTKPSPPKLAANNVAIKQQPAPKLPATKVNN